MTFQAPWLLLLVVPIIGFLWQYKHPQAIVNVLRTALSLTVLMGLAQPRVTLPSSQQDVIVVVDRSDSMPTDIESYTTEWIHSLETELGSTDTKGVLSIATGTKIDQPLSTIPFTGFEPMESTGQSNLNLGLTQALQLLESSSQGKIVLLSDGA